MGKDSGSPPPAPDPSVLAALQGKEDRKTLQYSLDNSRTSTVNPFGSTSWKNNKTFDQAGFDAAMAAYNTPGPAAYTPDYEFGGGGSYGPGSPTTGAAPSRENYEGRDNWVNTQALSKESQGIYDSSTAKLGEATTGLDTNFGDLTDATFKPGDGNYNQNVADAIFRRMRRYQDPADAQARSTQQANLADRGFQVGNEAYSTEVDRLDKSQQMAVADASDRAQIGGAQQGLAENNQAFNQKLSTRNAQQQLVTLLSNLRNQQVAGVSGMPSTTTTPSMAPVPIANMTMQKYQSDMDAYNAEQASGDAMMSSILGLAGTVGGAMIGGPAGASIGGSLGGMLGGGGGSKGGGSSGGYSGGGFNPTRLSGGGFWS